MIISANHKKYVWRNKIESIGSRMHMYRNGVAKARYHGIIRGKHPKPNEDDEKSRSNQDFNGGYMWEGLPSVVVTNQLLAQPVR